MDKISPVKAIFFSAIVIFLMQNWYIEKKDIKTDKYFYSVENERIKAFCVDFNWGPGGPNGFASPGVYANADPQKHLEWYKNLGVNTIQTFCISCCGYAWFQSDVAPVQPGMKGDFLKEITELGHKEGIRVMGYFCVGANTYWAETHPDQSYGNPSWIHIPLTKEYIDYLCACIEDALRKTEIDGFMIDWVFSPPVKDTLPVRWLDCEKQMYLELFDKHFPGKMNISKDIEIEFKRRATARCWKRIKETTKSIKPDCIIWLSCFDLANSQVQNSEMLSEVDWVMNETPDPSKLDLVKEKVGKHTKLIQCIVGGSIEYDASYIINNSKYKDVGLYGFVPWPDLHTTLPPENPETKTQINIYRNIETVRKTFKNTN